MERQTEGLPNLDLFQYKLSLKNGKLHHFVGNIDVTTEIRAPYISQKSSEIATLPAVRVKVNEIQREIVEGRSVVIEGRDIGSVVFPNAQVKIFLTADIHERARRRYEELKQKGGIDTLEEVLHDLEVRDLRDRTRADSPLIQCDDAVVVDTTHLSAAEVIETIVNITKRKRANPIWKYVVGEGRSGAPFLYKMVVFLTTLWYRLCYRFEVKGLENYPTGAAIIAPNHSSNLDPPAIGIACPVEVYCLAKSYLFKNKFLSWLLPGLIHCPYQETVVIWPS